MPAYDNDNVNGNEKYSKFSGEKIIHQEESELVRNAREERVQKLLNKPSNEIINAITSTSEQNIDRENNDESDVPALVDESTSASHTLPTPPNINELCREAATFDSSYNSLPPPPPYTTPVTSGDLEYNGSTSSNVGSSTLSFNSDIFGDGDVNPSSSMGGSNGSLSEDLMQDWRQTKKKEIIEKYGGFDQYKTNSNGDVPISQNTIEEEPLSKEEKFLLEVEEEQRIEAQYTANAIVNEEETETENLELLMEKERRGFEDLRLQAVKKRTEQFEREKEEEINAEKKRKEWGAKLMEGGEPAGG